VGEQDPPPEPLSEALRLAVPQAPGRPKAASQPSEVTVCHWIRRHDHRPHQIPSRPQLDTFWAGGIANPMEVIEQIAYLLFIRRLNDLQIRDEYRANWLMEPIRHPYFPKGKDGLGKGGGRQYTELRWSHFKHLAPADMYGVVSEHVFPFLRTLGGDDSTYAYHMKDARFTIPAPALLAKVVDLLDKVPLEDRDTKGDAYEYMLGRIASAGQNGQFRTPRHIIQLMVELAASTPKDVICDPACTRSSSGVGWLMYSQPRACLGENRGRGLADQKPLCGRASIGTRLTYPKRRSHAPDFSVGRDGTIGDQSFPTLRTLREESPRS
jgi:hypothetical protein